MTQFARENFVDPVNVQIDYFTITADRAAEPEIWAITKPINEALSGGYRQKQWRFFGYEGVMFHGKDAGHFAWGVSPYDTMGIIVQASGYLCNRYVDKFLIREARWSRLDIAVDCEFQEADPALCEVYYNWIAKNARDKRRQYALIKSSLGGQTLLIGNRASEEYGRFYDKGVEEKSQYAPGHKWRYEIELKGDKAKKGALGLMSLVGANADPARAMVSTVYDWFDKHDVPPLFRRSVGKGIDLRLTMSTPTDDKRLLWLRKQVSPTVRDLILTGNRDVLDALGITEFYNLERRRD